MQDFYLPYQSDDQVLRDVAHLVLIPATHSGCWFPGRRLLPVRLGGGLRRLIIYVDFAVRREEDYLAPVLERGLVVEGHGLEDAEGYLDGVGLL